MAGSGGGGYSRLDTHTQTRAILTTQLTPYIFWKDRERSGPRLPAHAPPRLPLGSFGNYILVTVKRAPNLSAFKGNSFRLLLIDN